MMIRAILNIPYLFFLLTILLSNVTYAASSEAVSAMQQMLRSMDHIKTLQCDVTQIKTLPKQVSLNYSLKIDSQGNSVAIVQKTGSKITHLKNKKGYYIIDRGEAQKQSSKQFPFENPIAFLKTMDLADVTENYKFLVSKKTDSQLIITMIPVGTGGKSIAQAEQNPVTMLSFELNLPFYTLASVEIFKNNRTTTKDRIEFDYDKVTNVALQEKNTFKNKYAGIEELALTHSKSTGDSGPDRQGRQTIQTKETWYSNIILNKPFEKQTFNEEGY